MTFNWNFTALLLLALSISPALADPPSITQLSAELEMKDFHDTAALNGPIEPGTPLVLTFKNNTTVKVTATLIEEKLIHFQAQILRPSGVVLYNAAFTTRYNADAELSEKKPDGDLLYRLKLNPHIATDK